MSLQKIIVIGGSAGALVPLSNIVELLPRTLPACVLVIIHTSADSDGVLPDVLRRRTSLRVAFANDHDAIEPGRILVAPPDRHLLVTASGVRVVHGPRENGFRPAVDPLFRTAARAFGSRVIGVILSGALRDGAYGATLIHEHGGTVVVQDPEDAIIDSMPRSALASVDADYVVRASEMPALLDRLTRASGVPGDTRMALDDDIEPQMPTMDTSVSQVHQRFGEPTALTCPDCGGALWEVQRGQVVRYQCHVGHQHTADVLDAEKRDDVDSALWTAVRVLEEYAELKSRLARRAADAQLATVAAGFDAGAREARRQAQAPRAALFTGTAGEAQAPRVRRAAAAIEATKARKIRRSKRTR